MNPPFWRKQVVRKNLVIPTEFSSPLFSEMKRDVSARGSWTGPSFPGAGN